MEVQGLKLDLGHLNVLNWAKQDTVHVKLINSNS